jgi:hypothetical protein
VGLVVVMGRSRWRWICGVAAALIVTVCSDFHFGAWVWWGIVTGGIVLLLVFGIPSRPRRSVPMTTSVTDVAPGRDHPPVLVGARP